MARFFNTTGPCDAERHYTLPPGDRMPALGPLVDRRLYFVVHAARQTGKTTAMRAFAAELRARGVVAVWATLEESQGVEEEERAEPRWLDAVASAAWILPEEDRPPAPESVLNHAVGTRFRNYLHQWCAKVGDRPVVLLLDEADTVSGPALVSLLRQLRAGFMDRAPGRFPVSVALIGMRDLRDYATQGPDTVSPGSPFNVKSDSVTLRGFTESEVGALLGQHTVETGQVFSPDAIAQVYQWGQGQPFLTNALARILTEDIRPNGGTPIVAADVGQAKERLVLARTTHLDALAERLRETRVARIVEAVLLGDQEIAYGGDDFAYTVDLGLLLRGPDGAEVANPLYREVFARELTFDRQENLPRPWWRWRTPTGGLDMHALSEAFQAWWRENAEMVEHRADRGYLEALPHITLMAFLQKVVNGGGTVMREYAAGRGRVDLIIGYGAERHVVEIKRVFDGGRRPEKVRDEGIRQLAGYLSTLGLQEGWLWIFDQRAGRSWEERLWSEDVEVDGKVLRLRGG